MGENILKAMLLYFLFKEKSLKFFLKAEAFIIALGGAYTNSARSDKWKISIKTLSLKSNKRFHLYNISVKQSFTILYPEGVIPIRAQVTFRLVRLCLRGIPLRASPNTFNDLAGAFANNPERKTA